MTATNDDDVVTVGLLALGDVNFNDEITVGLTPSLLPRRDGSVYLHLRASSRRHDTFY